MVRNKWGIFILVDFIFLITFSINSAWSAFPPIKFGFKTGGGLANIFGRDTYDQHWQEALAGGMFLNLPVQKRLQLEPEVIWVRQGSVYRLNLDQSAYQEKLILDYLEFPVLVKFYFLNFSRYKLYLGAGPSVAVNLRAKLRVTFDGLEESVEVNNLKGMDCLLNAGAGAEVNLKTGFIIFEFRYKYGLKSISTETETDVRNKSLVLLAGYKF